MSRNYANFDAEELEEMMDEMAVSGIMKKRTKVHTNGQKDQKRLRDTYIGANKKGLASRTDRAAKYAKEHEKRHERTDELSDLQNEICGRGKGKKRR